MSVTELYGNSWVMQFSLPNELQCSPQTFSELLQLRPNERGQVMVYGQKKTVPRWQQSYGRDYWFAGLNHTSLPIEHPYLQRLLSFVQQHSGQPYQQILVNWYMNGNEYISEHSDNESQLVSGSSIYSFSFGATRDFVVKSKSKTWFPDRYVFSLSHDTVMIMGGNMQQYYKHGVPKRLRVHEPRINITMRLYRDDVLPMCATVPARDLNSVVVNGVRYKAVPCTDGDFSGMKILQVAHPTDRLNK